MTNTLTRRVFIKQQLTLNLGGKATGDNANSMQEL